MVYVGPQLPASVRRATHTVDVRPAALPWRAWALGGLALGAWALAVSLLARDLVEGRSPWGAGAFTFTVTAALLWVLADFPTAYVLEGELLTIRTRLRSVRMRGASELRRVGTVGRDRFAINGGFGWYGWFHVDGDLARAWVTDPALAVRVRTASGLVLISPAPGELQRLARLQSEEQPRSSADA